MDRSDLGEFGASLPDGELAQALVAQGMLAQQGSVSWAPKEVGAVIQQLAEVGKDGFCEVASWWLYPEPINHDPAPQLAEAWRGFLSIQPRPRLEVQGDALGVSAERASWLARMCRHPQVNAASVYLRIDQPAWPVAWEWPLRFGVLGKHVLSARRARLERTLTQVGFDNLWVVVDMHEPGAECELLLLPGDLRQGLVDVLSAPNRLRADCALVLSGTRVSDARGFALKSALRREARTAGIAVLDTSTSVTGVLTELVRELSHDVPLDVALFNAARTAHVAKMSSSDSRPDLQFSRILATHSTVRLTAARVVHQFSSVRQDLQFARGGLEQDTPILIARPSPASATLAAARRANPAVETLARAMQDRVERGAWAFEAGDASDLVNAREEIVRTTGQRHRSARMDDAILPPQPVEDEDLRQVLAQVVEQGTQHAITYLRSNIAYRLRVKIGQAQGDFTGAGSVFPSHLLPASETGHQLEITFVPLVADAQGVYAAPQQRRIFLPPVGESTHADFVFHTHYMQGDFRSRLLISYQNRILQTLRLDGEINEPGKESPYSFGVENLVQLGFQNLAYQAPFDAALVVNHSQAGHAGITMIADSSVSFLEPTGMSEMLEALKAALTDETALRRAESSLESDPMTDLIYGLMQHGRLLYDYIEPQLGSLDADAGRIQMVEARSGAYFPLEFLYPLEVPPRKPPLCPHAAKALTGETSHENCNHRDDPMHMCPMRFWGFRKLIERQPAGAVIPDAHLPTITAPTPLRAKLNLFQSLQAAHSSRVQPSDFELPDGLLKVLTETFESVSTPGNWSHWKGEIAEQSPGFLLLLSHSTEDESSHLPAMEIGEDVLPVASLEVSYVKGPEAAAPVVFLMGCSTADPKVGFLSFVERFKRKQAALVVGTLSTISAQRAARFLALSLPMFKDPKNTGRPFGEVFLDVRRAALARGDGFAFSLVAYGDMSWQL